MNYYTPRLDSYRLIARTASCVVKGQFVDSQGRRVGECFSETVLTGAFSIPADLAGGDLDQKAVGAILQITGDDLVITTTESTGAEPSVGTTKANGIIHPDGSTVSIGTVAP